MSTKLNLRRAFDQSTQVFRRYMVPVCLPLVAVGLVSQGLAYLRPTLAIHVTPAFTILGFLLLATACIGKVAEVATSRMYLRAQEGVRPSGREVLKALRSPGLIHFMLGLAMRVILWCAVALLIAAAAYGLLEAVARPFRMAGFGATRVFDRMKVSDPVWVAFIFAGLIVPAILYRYVFVFQQFAIAPGSGTDFFDRCVRQANQVWKTAVLLSTGESLTILLIGHAAALIKRQEAHSARTIAVDITTCIVTNCFSVWLILLRTELAQQLGAAAQRGVTGDEPMITGEPSPA